MVEAPPEIWLYIAQFLPPSDLRKMISVNRTFFELVMDWRYRQAAFIHLNPFEFVKAMKRLEDPIVAKRVRSLQIWPCVFQNLSTAQPPILRRQRFQSSLSGFLASHFYFLRHSKRRSESNPQGTLEGHHWQKHPAADEVKKVFLDTVARFVGVTEFRIESHPHAYDRTSLPFLAAVWPVVGSNLRVLSMHMPLSKLCTIISSALGLDHLQELDIALKAEDLWPSANQPNSLIIEILGPFINRLNLTLRSFTIASSAHMDLSVFFDSLGHFPRLTKFAILVPFDLVHLSDTSGINRLLSVNDTIQHLILRPRYCCQPFKYKNTGSVVETWIKQSFSDVVLARLHTMEVGLNFIPGTLDTMMVHLGRFADTLSSLILMDRSLTYHEVEMAVSPFANRSAGLRSLSLFVRTLSPQLVDLLANKLPKLQKLELSIDKVVGIEGIDPPINQEAVFVVEMRRRTYMDWTLYDIAITQWVYSVGNLHQWAYMEAFAACIPTIRSFVGQGNMVIPS